MTAAVQVDAETEEEATRYATAVRCPSDGNFLPFSMNVDSIEEIVASSPRVPAGLVRVK
jgi:hypothetical protein